MDDDIDNFNLDKENNIRKKILRQFNKTQDDFTSLREYNDYLEQVEDIIFNLVNGIDIEKTNKIIADYTEQNRDQIAARQAQRAQEERQKQAKEQQRLREAGLSAMTAPSAVTVAVSGQSIATTVEGQDLAASRAQQQQQYSARAGMAAAAGRALPRQPAPKSMSTTALPSAPQLDETLKKRLRAAGYDQDVVYKRAFEEAFGTLFIKAQ